MTDPRFPNRPTHADFQVMSRVLVEIDKEADAGGTFENMAARYVDVPSLDYAAEQQTGMMLNRLGRKHVYSQREVAQMVQSAFLSAFVHGIRFEQERSRPAE